MGRSRPRVVAALLVGLAAAAVGVTAFALHALPGLEGDTLAQRFALRGPVPVRDVAVVAVDARTFSDVNRRWPFARRLHARVIDRLRAAGARVIAYDVQFTEQTTAADDNALFEAIARARNVVLATTEVGRHGTTNVLGGDANVAAAHARAANSALRPDSAGAFARVPARLDGLTSFAVAAAERASRHRIPAASVPARGAWIDFPGPPGTVPTLSFSRVLSGHFDKRVVRGRIVVVGASAPTLQDVHPTPAASGELMPGPEIQADAITTLLHGQPLRDAPGPLAVLAIVLLGLAAPLLGLRLGAVRAAGAALLAGALYLVAVQLSFNGGTILPVTQPVAALLLGVLGMVAAKYLAESRQRALTRAAFARFVPEQVVDELLDRSGGNPRLGGIRLDATVMFCDLRGFTRFAETLPAERVIGVLNRYLTEMSDAILDRGGTLVSYMGDGIMAVFGSPLPRLDHSDAALATAHEMVTVRLPRFNAWLREQGHESAFRMGIGLNTGPVMSGNVGSERRLEYAAIGDTTNLAARLEAMTKGTPHQVLLSAATQTALTGPAPALMEVGDAEVAGRAGGVSLWTLAPEGESESPTVGAEAAAALA